jgi:hypothetical protein
VQPDYASVRPLDSLRAELLSSATLAANSRSAATVPVATISLSSRGGAARCHRSSLADRPHLSRGRAGEGQTRCQGGLPATADRRHCVAMARVSNGQACRLRLQRLICSVNCRLNTNNKVINSPFSNLSRLFKLESSDLKFLDD